MYWRIVEVSGGEWQEYEDGEGDGSAAFAEYCEEIAQDRIVTKRTEDEIEAHQMYSGIKLRWCLRLIYEELWPFVVYYDDRKLDINVELFTFRAKDLEDANAKLCKHFGVNVLPSTFLVEKCCGWKYDPEVVELG